MGVEGEGGETVATSRRVKAWHFIQGELSRPHAEVKPVGNGWDHTAHVATRLRPGHVWRVKPKDLDMCHWGLHASRRVVDALQYAPGWTLCRVECRGEIQEDRDKLVCSVREILWWVDFKEVLLEVLPYYPHVGHAPHFYLFLLGQWSDAVVYWLLGLEQNIQKVLKSLPWEDYDG